VDSNTVNFDVVRPEACSASVPLDHVAQRDAHVFAVEANKGASDDESDGHTGHNELHDDVLNVFDAKDVILSLNTLALTFCGSTSSSSMQLMRFRPHLTQFLHSSQLMGHFC